MESKQSPSFERSVVRRLDLTSLRMFVSVCAEKNIGRAAEREHVAPSAISKRIAELEDVIGSTLFYRHQKGVTPTPAGECLLRHAQSLLRGVENLAADLSEFSEGSRGHIRLYANRSSIMEFLPEDLSAFRKRYPLIDFQIDEFFSEQIVDGVRNGFADLGICMADTESSGLEAFDYRQDRLVVVVNRDHPLADCTSVRFSDTLDFDHIAVETNNALYRTLVAQANAEGRELRFVVHVNGLEAVCRMAQVGLGIGVVASGVVAMFEEKAGLRAIDIQDSWATRHFKVVCRGYKLLPAASRQFIDHLMEMAGTSRGAQPA